MQLSLTMVATLRTAEVDTIPVIAQSCLNRRRLHWLWQITSEM
jgi:hypothetical protein